MPKIERTLNRSETAKELAKSEINSLIIVLVLSFDCALFSANKNKEMAMLRPNPSASSNDLNKDRRRCLGIKSKLITNADIIGALSNSVPCTATFARIGIIDLIVCSMTCALYSSSCRKTLAPMKVKIGMRWLRMTSGMICDKEERSRRVRLWT
jgi:hypothetical protein